MELNEKIKFIRMFKGWSQEEMAEKLGMALHGYGKIERGEVDINFTRLKQIAEIFGVDLAQLVSLNEKTVFNLLLESDHSLSLVTWGNNCHIEYTECRQHELEKLNMLLEQKDNEITLLKQQIHDLREMINLLQKDNTSKI